MSCWVQLSSDYWKKSSSAYKQINLESYNIGDMLGDTLKMLFLYTSGNKLTLDWPWKVLKSHEQMYEWHSELGEKIYIFKQTCLKEQTQTVLTAFVHIFL